MHIFKNLFVDGTKIEAYANKYTFVWKSAVEKNLAKLENKISVLVSVLSERYGFSESINRVILKHRPKVLEALTSEEGTLLRMNRSIQVEGVLGVLKEDYGFRRFLTRGKRNVETQFFLLTFALNVEKLCNRTKKGRIGLDLFQLNAS